MKPKDLVLYFFKQIGKKPTANDMLIGMRNVKTLLDKHTPEEIKIGIDYFVSNPPPKGFYSLGWLQTTLDEVLIKKRAEKVKSEMENVGSILGDRGEYPEYKYQRDNIPTWIRKGYSLDLFTKPDKDSGN